MEQERLTLIEDTATLGPAIKLELSRENVTPPPEKARFEIMINPGINMESGVEDISPDEIQNTTEVFTQQFHAYMTAQGYRLKPTLTSDPKTSIACFELDIGGRSDAQLTNDFEAGIRQVKRILATMRYDRTDDTPRTYPL